MKYFVILMLLPVALFGAYIQPAKYTNIRSGSGTFSNPFICNTSRLSWKCDVPDKYKSDQFELQTEIHLDGYRNCSTQYQSGAYGWRELESETFTFSGFRAGMCYFRISAREAGSGGNFVEISSSSRMHVHFELPPWETPTPGKVYYPDISPAATITHLDVVNKTSGSGTQSNPWHFIGSVVRFECSFSDYDGAYLWCVERNQNASGSCLMNPHRYMLSQLANGDVWLTSETAVSGTFAPIEHFDAVQEFDFNGDRCIRSGNNKYKLVFELMNKNGTRTVETYWLYFDPDNVGGESIQAPSAPVNLRVE